MDEEEVSGSKVKKMLTGLLPNSDVDFYFKLIQFILENRLPYTTIEPFIKFFNEVMVDLRINSFKKIFVSSTSAQTIAAECITKELKDLIFAKLREKSLSLSFDGISDLYGTSYLAVSAKYLEDGTKFLESKLMTIILMEDSSTGKIIFDKIQKEILCNRQLKNNLTAIVSDYGSTMTSKQKCASSRLCKQYSHIVRAINFSYAYNLVIKGAIKKFSSEIVDIVSHISRHLKKSAKGKLNCFKYIEK